MNYQALDLHMDDRGPAYVTLNAIDTPNALSARMISELTDIRGLDVSVPGQNKSPVQQAWERVFNKQGLIGSR